MSIITNPHEQLLRTLEDSHAYNQPSSASPELEANAEAPVEPGSDDYSYGYAPPTGGLPTHVSDGELLLWLEHKSQETYGRVREVMEISTERSKLMQDLTHVKGLIEGDASGTELNQALDDLSAAYAGTPFEDEVAALVASVPRAETVTGPLGPVTDDNMTDEQEKALAEDFQAEIDKLGRDDQLALVQIQDLMSNIREMSQLTSNLLASRDQASNTIVGNIRG